MSTLDDLERRVEEIAPTQSEFHLVGTLKSQAQRGVFYFSLYNFAQILYIGYQNGAFASIFSSFWVYLAANAVVFSVIIAIDYIIVLPGEKKYQARQNYVRDPIREDVKQIQEDLDDLREDLINEEES